ncbi:hypothetical protein V5799_031384 [Amblyomma americanum]|uniref:Uncharacterized protein n=1 Tax=Amblyomma americanum TaxID=6943 RepID=A0AAQ4EKZ4_AMBAM
MTEYSSSPHGPATAAARARASATVAASYSRPSSYNPVLRAHGCKSTLTGLGASAASRSTDSRTLCARARRLSLGALAWITARDADFYFSASGSMPL